MNRKQFFLCFLGIGVSAFLGGFVAIGLLGARAATAQVPQPIVQNQQVVPNAGLRFIDEQGRVIAVIGKQGQNGVLTLMDSEGRPSVVIQADPGGRATLMATEGGGELRLNSQQGSGALLLSSTQRSRGLGIVGPNGSKLFDLQCANRDSTMMMAEAGGKKGLDFRAGQMGGEFTWLNNIQTPVGALQSNEEGGFITLTAPKKPGALSALSGGKVTYRENGKIVWQFPPSE